MKTAISIPDPIFHSAEVMAQNLSISRSELFTKAMSEYLNNHQYDNVTDVLNRVYAKNASSIDQELVSMQLNSLERDAW